MRHNGVFLALLIVSSAYIGYLLSELMDHLGTMRWSARLAKEIAALGEARGEAKLIREAAEIGNTPPPPKAPPSEPFRKGG